MSTPATKLDGPSRAFEGVAGETTRAIQFAKSNYVMDAKRYDSEGNWAFCVFEGEEFPVARFGFQRGGFNITNTETQPDKSLLQLHLEIVTDKGAVLWVPTGEFDVRDLTSAPDKLDLELNDAGRRIFSIRGWPESRWHFRSADGELEIELEFSVVDVTILPDCILPYSVFAMWETVANVSGTIRYKDRSSNVKGKVFNDHPRVINDRSHVKIRNSYLYTAAAFEDGSAWYSYHAQDPEGIPIPYYCFGDYIDPEGRHEFSNDTQLIDIQYNESHLPISWKISWRGARHQIILDVTARPFSILRSWGKAAPANEKEFWIFPFVLDCTAEVDSGGGRSVISGRGLPEYFNLERFPT
jgi:hypothetical protein